jgi:hypothetical protein
VKSLYDKTEKPMWHKTVLRIGTIRADRRKFVKNYRYGNPQKLGKA